VNGECVLFCDKVTDSIQRLLDISEYRRTRQQEHNEDHGITPQSVKRAVQESLQVHSREREEADHLNASIIAEDEATYDKVRVIAELEGEMRDAAARLEFERAAHIRDQIVALKEGRMPEMPTKTPVKYPKGRRGKK
jgi:excinuclease ABC subunit B